MKRFLVLTILLANIALGQQGPKAFFLEINSSQVSSSEYTCYFSYRISYDRLFFTKEKSGYNGGLTVRLELFRNDTIYKRISGIKDVIVDNYDNTKRKDLFIQGLITENLPKGEYLIKPIVQLTNTKKEYFLAGYTMSFDKNSLSPVIMNSTQLCDGIELANIGKSIPYAEQNYNLYFLLDKSIEVESVELIQDNDKITEYSLVDENKEIIIEECDNNITAKTISGNRRLYVIENVNVKLIEGKAELTVFTDDEDLETELDVYWFNKPYVLYNTELAIDVLKHIIPEDTLDNYFDVPRDEEYKTIFKFWKKYKKNDSSFNNLMNEFYKRADFAIINYTATNGRKDRMSDRGKIYLRYGEPDDTKRNFLDDGEVAEIWKYSRLKKQFIFIDKTGLGNFTLQQ